MYSLISVDDKQLQVPGLGYKGCVLVLHGYYELVLYMNTYMNTYMILHILVKFNVRHGKGASVSKKLCV